MKDSRITEEPLAYMEGPRYRPIDTTDESFFNAIEVNTPMLISPIMMVPRHIPPGELQEEYLKNVGDISVRSGPTITNRERVETRVKVEKADFVQRSTLMAAPILFQTRARKTATCPFTTARCLSKGYMPKPWKANVMTPFIRVMIRFWRMLSQLWHV